MWQNNSPVMIVSYYPEPNKNIRVVSTAHGEPNICDAPDKRPMVIEFHNSRRCCVNIINQILRDYSYQLRVMAG